MPLKLDVQIDIIFYGIMAGLLLGILFDVYRIIRGSKVSSIIIFIEDILFCILSAIIIFIFLLYKNYAFLGPYVYIFIGGAFVIYSKFLSQYFIRIEIGIINCSSVFFRVLLKLIIYPLKVLLSKMGIKNK